MAQILKCPTREELVRLNDDELPGDLSESLFDHIEHCERCSSIYGELDDPPDNFASRFAQISPDDLEKAREDIESDALRESLFPKLSGLLRERELQPALHPPCDLKEYKVLRRIGFGGMGEVYEAQDPLLGRHVAIKVVRRFRQDDPEAVKHFLSEIRTAGQSKHPNLVAAYHAWLEQDGNLFLAQEFLEGESLQELVNQENFGGPKEIIDAMIGTCRGLEQLHVIELVHRDIKPANVMRLEDGTIKVIDFGLAMAAEAGKSATRVGAGTVGYMAPEQAHGTGPIDHRSDIYSAGRMLKYLLAKTPIASASKRQIRAVQKLNALAEWMTRKSPKARPKDITVVISRLEKMRRALFRSRVKTVLAASAVLAAVALGIWVFLANYGGNTEGILDRSVVQDEVTRQLDARQQQANEALAKDWNNEVAPRLERETTEFRSNVEATLGGLSSGQPDQALTSDLASILPQLPEMVTPTVPQPPIYEQGTGELVYTVRLAPNEAAYRASLPRLRQTLDSIAIGEPDEITVRPTSLRSDEPGDVLPVYSIPQIESDPRTAGTQGVVSLLIDWNNAQTFQVWRHYVVDFGAVDVKGTGWQFIKPTNQHWLQTVAARGDDDFGKVMAFSLMTRTIETQFLDDSGSKVDIDSWEWLGRNYVDVELPQSTLSNGLSADRTLSGVPNVLVSPIYQHLPRPDEPVLVTAWTQGAQSETNNFHATIAPFSMVQSTFAGTSLALVFSPASVQTRRIRMDSELWRKIATVKVSTRTATAR
ncbi:serine/threonine-protein kinase [Rosistilla oblonga]|uniref:serine/threonine-protein kinase n=1 Tax=Rosistilla oblonga TaxID=2527990 RepID=UPI003A96ECC6